MQGRNTVTDEIYIGIHDFMYDDGYNYSDIDDMCLDCDISSSVGEDKCMNFCAKQYTMCMMVCMKHVSDMYFDRDKFCYREDVEHNSLYYPFNHEVCNSYEDIDLEKTGLTKICSSSCADRRNLCLGTCM
ncbi:hypothetical protein GUI12_03320 [Anaplasmataceae bacterium AB001_6]|nr:hypothetical protein GUI12_03320 [Anaplasmataceae bacterium AB001_6]